MKLGLYGGSFDPVHYGHVRVARRALDELALDRLLVIPASVSPFKTDRPPDGWWDRLALLKAAFGAVERAEVDERELRRGGVSYAIDTVRELKGEYPADTEFFFIIGEDSRAGLEQWREIDELRRLVKFVAYPRTEESSSSIRALFTAAGVRLNDDAGQVAVVRRGLAAKGGFCPCRIARTPENFCPCAEFRAQLADGGYHGWCHCRYFFKP